MSFNLCNNPTYFHRCFSCEKLKSLVKNFAFCISEFTVPSSVPGRAADIQNSLRIEWRNYRLLIFTELLLRRRGLRSFLACVVSAVCARRCAVHQGYKDNRCGPCPQGVQSLLGWGTPRPWGRGGGAGGGGLGKESIIFFLFFPEGSPTQ